MNLLKSILIISLLISLNFNTTISSADINSTIINDSKIIFDNIINITNNSIWLHWPAVLDTDNNGYPEIISYPLPDTGYSKGLYFFEYNYTSLKFEYERMNISNLTYVQPLNVYGDKTIDLVSPFGFYENKEGYFENLSNIYDRDYFALLPTASDIDSDGLMDFIYSDFVNGMFIERNQGNGSFTSYGFDDGLPRFGGFKDDPRYGSLYDHQMRDVNNDGWLDICSGMGNSNNPKNTNYESRWYNWISDGKGNWEDYSKGFPTHMYGINIDLADLDLDGDLDFGLLTDQELIILENSDQSRWKKITNLTFPDNIKSFEFFDIDFNGLNDIIFITSSPSQDNNSLIKNNLKIAYQHSIWNFTIQDQISFESGYPKEMYISDYDQDGDLDIISSFSHHDELYTFYTGGLVAIENNGNVKRNLTLINGIENTHVRSGSIFDLSWTHNRTLVENCMFNISISYTGMNGIYTHLLRNHSNNHAPIRIPDIPSSNCYIKVDNGFDMAYQGPFTIHNGENLTDPLKLLRPRDREFLYGGYEYSLKILSSKFFPSQNIKISVSINQTLMDIGTYHVNNDSLLTVKWNIPDDIVADDCKIHFEYVFNKSIYNHENEITFSIVPRSNLPRDIQLNRSSIYQNVLTNISFRIISFENKTISDGYNFSFYSRNGSVELKEKNGTEMKLVSSHIGKVWMSIMISIYGYELNKTFQLKTHYPLAEMRLIPLEDDFKIGRESTLRLESYDFDGIMIPSINLTTNWTINGDAELIFSNNSIIKIIPFSLEEVIIQAEKDSGLSLVRASYSLTVISPFSDLFIHTERRYSEVNQSLQFTLKSVSQLDPNQINLTWMLNSEIQGHGNMIKIYLSEIGNQSISCNIKYFNASFILSTWVYTLPTMEELFTPRNDFIIKKGENISIPVSILDTLGNEYSGPFSLHYTAWGPISCFLTENLLTIIGTEEGYGELYLSGHGEFRTVNNTIRVKVVRIPTSIKMQIPDTLLTNNSYIIAMEVLDHQKDTIENYSVHADMNGNFLEIDGMNSLNLFSDKSGYRTLRITVKYNEYYINRSFKIEFLGFPELNIEMISGKSELGSDLRFRPVLFIDQIVSNKTYDYQINHHENIEIITNETGYYLRSDYEGNYSITIVLDYYDIKVQETFNVSFYESSMIDEVQLLRNGKNLLIYVFDQNGKDITRNCTITVEGNLTKQDFNSYNIKYGIVIVNIKYHNDNYSEKIDFGEKDGNNNISLFNIIIGIIIFISIVIMIIYMFIHVNIKQNKKNLLNKVLREE